MGEANSNEVGRALLLVKRPSSLSANDFHRAFESFVAFNKCL